ncbi:MAG TPA: hydrogenase/urease maturation nickel metallochaperone HypA [Gemmatimonadales bacterium]|nr:hydrogenase/urease maturation nickel metallochaperone HypA [Gemmatimonadales bacterium]
MHEMSLALEVCRLAERQVGRAALGSVTAVAVIVGDDAGVERENLAFCLETLLAMPPFAGARPVLVAVPGDELRLDYLELDDGRQDD